MMGFKPMIHDPYRYSQQNLDRKSRRGRYPPPVGQGEYILLKAMIGALIGGCALAIGSWLGVFESWSWWGPKTVMGAFVLGAGIGGFLTVWLVLGLPTSSKSLFRLWNDEEDDSDGDGEGSDDGGD
jgi:hypothetical protein